MVKKIITIVLPIIAITAAIFIFGLKVYEDSFDKFQYDGYVIGASTGKETAKYHFTKNEKYKVNTSKEEVVFTNNEDEEVTIPNASFVHYTDGSISTFKKAVVLNLENVKTDSLQYYNIFNGSVFTKTSEGYQIKYLEDKLNFSNFIVKVSDTKFMIVGKNLKIKYGDKEETINDGFLEINYLDGNIIRIENQDFLLQNISNDFGISINEVQVDLLNKKIMYQEETKVNLGEITIDSDDNIEIIPDDENTKIDQDEMQKIEDIENNPVVTPGSDVSGMESGIVDTTIEKADEIIQENETIPDAVFKTVIFNVNAISMNATVSVEDSAHTLKGLIEYKVIENATNRVMIENKIQLSGQSFSVEAGNLMPDTNYSLIVSSMYEKNEVTYQKDFLQRTFVTKSVGFTMEKDYVSTDLMAFKVLIPEESTLAEFTYQVIESADPDNVLQSGTFDRKKAGSLCNNSENDPAPANTTKTECSVTVDRNVLPNTKYSLIIKDIEYDLGNNQRETFPEDSNFQVYKTLKTLKQRPVFGSTSVITNKMSSTFQISLNSVTDPNNSVLSYRADIYLEGQESSGTPIATREASAANQLNVQIDGTVLQRRTSYIAKIYATYYDNEKEYDVLVGTTPTLNMTSSVSATVSFKELYIRHDLIQGEIIINDPDSTIVEDTIKLKVQNASETTEAEYPSMQATSIEGTTTTYRIELTGLKKNSSYIFTVQAQVLLEADINPEPSFTNIGQFVVTTKPPEIQQAWIKNVTSENNGSYFTIQYMITPKGYYTLDDTKPNLSIKESSSITEDQKNKAWHEIKTLEKIVFRLRRKSHEVTSAQPCTVANYCWEFDVEDEENAYDDSTIKSTFYPEGYNPNAQAINIPTIRPSHQTGGLNYGIGVELGLPPYNQETNEGGLPKDTYVIEILEAYDYTDYENKIIIDDGYVEFYSNAENDTDVITSEVTMTETANVDTGYTITTDQYVSDYNKDIVQTGAEHIKEETYEHFIVNMSTGEICQIPENGAAPDEKYNFIKNKKDVEIKFDKFNEYYEKLAEDSGNDDYLKCKIQRGNTYGYYYNYILKAKVGAQEHEYKFGAEKSFKIFEATKQPVTTLPKIATNLNKTIYAEESEENGSKIRYLIDYKIKDEDNALTTKPSLSYKNPAAAGYLPVRCGENYDEIEDCIELDDKGEASGTIALKNDSNNSLVVTLLAEVKERFGVNNSVTIFDIASENNITRSVEVEEQTINMVLMQDVELKKEYNPNASVNIGYSVDTTNVQNSVVYTISSLSNITKADFVRMFVGAKLTLSGSNGVTKVYYKNFHNNGYNSGRVDAPDAQILLSFGEMLELMGSDVTTTIELLYDTNYYGYNYNASEAPKGLVIQAYTRANEYKALKNFDVLTVRDSSLTCNGFTKECELRYKSNMYDDEYYEANPLESVQLTNSSKGLYHEPAVGTKEYITMKKLDSVNASCATGNCVYKFETVIPTLYMEDQNIEPTAGGVNYKINFSMVHDVLYDAEGNSKHFKLIAYYFKDANLSIPMMHDRVAYRKEFLLEDMTYDSATSRYTFTENNLRSGEKYFVIFKWINDTFDEDEEQSFFYSADWHSANQTAVNRVYSFSTLYTPNLVKNLSLTYQTGTNKRYKDDHTLNNSFNSNTDQDPVYNRGLLMTLSVMQEPNNVIRGYKVKIRIDGNEDGDYEDENIDYTWTEFDLPVSSFAPDGERRTIKRSFSIDPKEITVGDDTATRYLTTSTKFAAVVEPYGECYQGGLAENGDIYEDWGANCNEATRTKTYYKVPYKRPFSIPQPKISIVRVENPEDSGFKGVPDVFSLRIVINDTGRTVGKYSYRLDPSDPEFDYTVEEEAVYYLDVYKDNDPVPQTYTRTSDKAVVSNWNINSIQYCQGAQTCKLVLRYGADLMNSEIGRTSQTEEKIINMSYNYDVGSISRGTVNASNIYIYFKQGLNVSSTIGCYDLTLEGENGQTLSLISEPAVITTNAAGTTDTFRIKLAGKITLAENVLYSITLQFKTADEIPLEQWSAEGISYTTSAD